MLISLIWLKVRLNLKSEASKSQLNYLWWVIEPALFIGIYYIVFGVLMNNKDKGFVEFLIVGKITFLWFSRTAMNSCGAILSGKGLMNQFKINSIFFPAVVVLQDAVKMLVVIPLMLLTLAALGVNVNVGWLYVMLTFAIQLMFLMSMGVIFAYITPIFNDFRFLVNTFVILMMFGSGIFFDPERLILPEHIDSFYLNPLALIIKLNRAFLLYGDAPVINDIVYLFTLSVCCLLIACGISLKLDKRILQYAIR